VKNEQKEYHGESVTNHSNDREFSDEDDDLTDLSWLHTFNLGKQLGLCRSLTLSPPPSPPSTSKLAATMADESDSCSSNMLSSKSRIKKSIMDLIRHWTLVSSTSAKTSVASSTHPRPPYSFSCLTFLAIEASERKRLSVKEIYAWIIENFPYYRSVPSGSWKNSIRQNLSYNSCFCKVDKNLLAMRDFSGKGSLWCISSVHRAILLDALLEESPIQQEQKLIGQAFLQDISETTKSPNSVAAANISISRPKVGKSSSLPTTPLISLSSSKSSLLAPVISSKEGAISSSSTRLNSILLNKYKLTSNSSLGQSKLPKITSVTKNEKGKSSGASSENLSKQSRNDSESNFSDMDAVNALLSMRSKTSSSSSIQINERQGINSTFMKSYSFDGTSSSTSTSISIDTSNNRVTQPKSQTSVETRTRSRRKQILKPPTKKPTKYNGGDYDEADDADNYEYMGNDEELNENSSGPDESSTRRKPSMRLSKKLKIKII
jgi:hypothetical protein